MTEPIVIALDLAEKAAEDHELYTQGQELGKTLVDTIEEENKRKKLVLSVIMLGLYLAMISIIEAKMSQARRTNQH